MRRRLFLSPCGILSSIFILAASALTACSDDARPSMMPDAASPPDDARTGPGVGQRDAHASPKDAHTTTRDAGQVNPTSPKDASQGGMQDVFIVVPAPCTGAPPVMKALDASTNTEFDPDLSCYETGDAATSALPDAGLDAGNGSTRSATMRLGPLPSVIVGEVTIDIFFGTSTLTAPDVTRTFGLAADTVTFPIPKGLSSISARLREQPRDGGLSVAEIRQYGLSVPMDGAPIEGYVALEASLALAVNLALGGGTADRSKALLFSIARDCRGNAVSGVQFELVDGTTGRPVPTGTEPADVHSSYGQFGLPTTTCTFSTNQQSEALWLLVNAPVNVAGNAKTHSYRLRVKGRRRESDLVPVVLREREVELFAGGTTFVRP